MADQESMGPSTPKKDPEEPVWEGTTMKRPAAATPKAPKKEKAKKTEETKKTPKAADKETKKNPKAVDEETEKETEKKNPKTVDKETKKKPEKKSKTAMKSNLKRPAAKNAMKKPAAAGGSSRTHPKAVEPPLPEGEEEESMDDDPESQDCFEVEEARKDRSKWTKFKKLLDQGSLPDFIKKAYQEAQKLKTGKGKAIRQIVNNVLDRDPKNGSLVVNLENPALKCFKVGLGFCIDIYIYMCTVLVSLYTYEFS